MKIACLLGVSTYTNLENLPACKNDVELMRLLLDSTKEYSEILYLAENDFSHDVKKKVTAFIKKYEKEELEQVLFYYTGHGSFDGDDFYYLLSDFSDSHRRTTAIENKELDNWLRDLGAEMTIKIIDACHAGVEYLKEPDSLAKYLDGTPKEFNDCYFLFSSRREQYSYQNSGLSYFTKSFIEAVATFAGDEMRFKDIVDYISDSFSESGHNQTPFFITQATYTEKFANVDDKLREMILERMKAYSLSLSTTTSTTTTTTTTSLAVAEESSLIVQIESDAAKFFDEDYVLRKLEAIKLFCEKRSSFDEELDNLYRITPQILPALGEEIPNLDVIGRYLEENENDYFAEPIYETVRYKEEADIPPMFRPFQDLYGKKSVIRHKQVTMGYRLTHKTDFVGVRILAKPKFLNLKWYDCHIVFVLSKTEIRFFYLFCNLRELNWKETKPVPIGNWRIRLTGFSCESQITNTLQEIAREFENVVMGPIHSKYLSQGRSDRPNSEPKPNDS